MGRKPISDEIKKMRGTDQPCRMKGDLGIPKIISVQTPTYLSREAKKIFVKTAHQLMCNNILTSLDVEMLAQYAMNVGRAIEAEKILQKETPIVTIKDEDGNILGQQMNQWFVVQKDCLKLASSLAQQFGLSPVSRMKIATMLQPKEEDKDDFTEFEDL